MSEMRAVQQRLFDRGICIYHSTYLGAGPEGVIRCAVFRDHTQSDIDALVESLSDSGAALAVVSSESSSDGTPRLNCREVT
jgi:hypothetical protein